jgi:hypothetical protein
MCSGGAQQAQLGERGLARADKYKDSGGGIEKQRKETHPHLRQWVVDVVLFSI